MTEDFSYIVTLKNFILSSINFSVNSEKAFNDFSIKNISSRFNY